MAQNEGTPGAGRRSGAPKNVAVGTADISDLALDPIEIQTARLRSRFDFSPSLAAAVAALAFPVLDDWRARA